MGSERQLQFVKPNQKFRKSSYSGKPLHKCQNMYYSEKKNCQNMKSEISTWVEQFNPKRNEVRSKNVLILILPFPRVNSLVKRLVKEEYFRYCQSSTSEKLAISKFSPCTSSYWWASNQATDPSSDSKRWSLLQHAELEKLQRSFLQQSHPQ